jgi:hypothetical protein
MFVSFAFASGEGVHEPLRRVCPRMGHRVEDGTVQASFIGQALGIAPVKSCLPAGKKPAAKCLVGEGFPQVPLVGQPYELFNLAGIG